MMQLRGYQLDIIERGTDILLSHSILYLAMEVRTGKTLTSLNIAENAGATSVLFVTKKKAMSSIEKDYESRKFTFELDLLNYEALHKLSPDDIAGYDLVICDEAHCLGAFPKPSLRTQQLKKLVGTKLLILLSGTPTPESHSQMYMQMYISEHSPWKQYRNFYAWAKDYVTVRKKYVYNRELNDYSHADRGRIDSDMKHLMISFTQEEAGFVQSIEEVRMEVKMKDATYDAIRRLLRDNLLKTSQGMVIADTAAKLQQKAHQMYSGTVIIDEADDLTEGETKAQVFDVTKAEFIRDNFKGQKIAIFYKFKAEEHMLYLVFGQRITKDSDEFNQSGADRVYISQIQSGREGVNLSSADCIVMLNIDFSAVSYFQARARLQSKDRERPAMVYWIMAQGGIEQKIYERVQDKKDYTLFHFKRDFLS